MDECCTECDFIGAFTVDGECFHYTGVSSIAPYNARFTESDASIEKDPDARDSYISPNSEGKYNMYRSVGDNREKCTSRGYIEDFDSLVDINKMGWDCSDYSGSGSRNPSVSCGCWNEDTISEGGIAGIVIGVVVALGVLAFCFRRHKRSKESKESKEIVTSLPEITIDTTPTIV